MDRGVQIAVHVDIDLRAQRAVVVLSGDGERAARSDLAVEHFFVVLLHHPHGRRDGPVVPQLQHRNLTIALRTFRRRRGFGRRLRRCRCLRGRRQRAEQPTVPAVAHDDFEVAGHQPWPDRLRAARMDRGVQIAVHVDLDLCAQRALLVLPSDSERVTRSDRVAEHLFAVLLHHLHGRRGCAVVP